MAACPNCGRQTLRTKDWACQWCGYPLISRAFKTIDKTFKELQEERSLAATRAEPDADTGPEFEPEYEAETESEPEPEPKPEPKQKPKFRFLKRHQPTPPMPGNEPGSDRVPGPESRPQPRPIIRRPETRPDRPPPPVRRPAPPSQPAYRPEPEPEPPKPVSQPAPESAPEAEPAPQPQYKPEPVTEPDPEPKPAAAAPPPAPEPPKTRPEIIVAPPLPPVSNIKPEDIKDGMEINIDDLDGLFRLDKSGTNMKLNGKTIILKGIVEKVFIREHLEIRYIVVKGKGRSVWSARCTFEQENAGKASRLNEGEEVAVRGKYDGYGKNVIFKECEVV